MNFSITRWMKLKFTCVIHILLNFQPHPSLKKFLWRKVLIFFVKNCKNACETVKFHMHHDEAENSVTRLILHVNDACEFLP